ncbi:FecCD family ABC transporter permease [[Clostridium] colinum]|uniref:FecCD family ABC transporter permease n=1 Tax=[Clostridium] colinum TaxID=36835 RepID=UPI0020246A62|nr:iron ABC transporter permease [[Clostridium] colinum]
MKNIFKVVLCLIISGIVLILAMGIGSVFIPPIHSINILLYKIFNFNFIDIDETFLAILWKIRFPRVLLAFICGAGLSLSGTIIQSLLKNSLASSYTLGVSSGAALGASICILFKIYIFGIFSMQIFGFIFGIITVFMAITIATKMDKTMQNNAIILTGMAFSLFANAMLSIMMTFAKEDLQSLIFWQMGSFSMKDNIYLFVLYPAIFIVFILVFFKHREMDILTFGDEQASISGVEVKKLKLFLLAMSSLLTGFIVSIVGVIGFIDLFTPHITRKIFGAKHKYVLFMSLILGGTFMVLCDLIARTIASPIELPVGAITSAIGAPFFIYLYFDKKR